MTSIIPPNLFALIVGPLIYFFYRKSLNYLALFTALLTLFMVAQLDPGIYGGVKILNYEFLLKVDKLSLFFAYVFSLIGFVGLLYALQVEDPIQISAGLLYMACAVGVTLAYDWLSFYVFWEGLAVFAVLLVISARTKEAYYSSIRYILVHAISGLSLLLGILLLWYDYGITKVENLRTLGYSLPYFLILLSFVINAAVPSLNAWLPDAYPNSTIYGSVFLSAFTTKSAVYALVRVFPGEYVLAVAGAIMAFYGVVYATLENNPRRLLSYHIISQVGFMVCGAGLGSAMALNGASAHAFAHIIYKGLLFMSAGAVIYATGIQRIHLLGGFAKKNPWIALYFFIGALSISGVPLTSGFVSKSITIHASTLLHRPFEYLLMELASIGTFFSIVLKMGYYIFFGKEGDYEVRPIPWNMHLAMIIASLLCILIGIFPQYYYQFLPYSEHYEPYTYQHTVGVISLFSCVALVFFVVRYYIAPKPKINLDTDWFYIILSFIFLVLYPPNFSNQINFSSHFLNLKVHYLFRLIFLFLGILLYIFLYKFFLNEKYINEFSFFLGTTISFLSLISSSQNIFLAFILMEAISFSFYLLISFYKREILCLESGLKYYILGTISSIFFFTGLFLIYYSSLEINFFHGLTKIIYSKKATYFFLGLILIFSSLTFKLGASPFHFWLPEVYQGSPLPVFPILIAFSKLSFALFLSNLILIFLYNGGGSITKEIFYNFFYIVSILSMIVGNLFALKQKELKRLLAYSSISHIGYLLTLFSIPWSNENLKLFYSYIFIYVLTNFEIFLAISIFINFKDIKIPIETFKDHLKYQNFLILFSLLIFFFSLAGLPPTAGFITKFFLLLEIVKKGSYLLAFIFLLTSILSTYYYFRLINPVLTVFRKGVYEGGYMKREFNEIFIMIILLGLSFYLLLSTFKPVVIFFFA